MSATHPFQTLEVSPADMDPLFDTLPDLALDELSQALAGDQLLVDILLNGGDSPLDVDPGSSDSQGEDESVKPIVITVPPVAPRAPMKNPSRERMKAELRLLRGRVADMEQELKAAKERQASRREAEKFKATALAQLTKRRRAEAENLHLRETLEQQINIASTLETVLVDLGINIDEIRKHELPRRPKRPRSSTVGADLVTVDELKKLEEEAVSAYDLVDRVLEVCNMKEATVQDTSTHAAIKTSVLGGQEQLFVELVGSRFVPFDLARSSDALWQVLTSESFTTHDIDLMEKSPTTIRVKASFSWRVKEIDMRLRVTIVLRRFISAHRTVIVWRAVTHEDTSENADSELKQTGSDETGWVVIRELDSPSSDVKDRSCVLQTVSYHAPIWGSQVATTKDKRVEIGEFKSMVLNSTEDDIATMTCAMENLLVADGLHTVAAT